MPELSRMLCTSGIISTCPAEPPALTRPIAMLRFSGEAMRPTAGNTTPKVVQLTPIPTSSPMPTISIGPEGATAATPRPAANVVAPNATTGAEP